MTLLGYEVERPGEQPSGGSASWASPVEPTDEGGSEGAIRYFEQGGQVPLIAKADLRSTVHRRVPLDLIVVPLRESGKITGIGVHAGLWTSQALSAPIEEVPVLRRQLAALEKDFGFDPSGHGGKALRHALAALPRDLMVNLAPDDVKALVATSISLADRPRPGADAGPLASCGAICSPSSGCRATSSPPAAGVEIGEMIAEAAERPDHQLVGRSRRRRSRPAPLHAQRRREARRPPTSPRWTAGSTRWCAAGCRASRRRWRDRRRRGRATRLALDLSRRLPRRLSHPHPRRGCGAGHRLPATASRTSRRAASGLFARPSTRRRQLRAENLPHRRASCRCPKPSRCSRISASTCSRRCRPGSAAAQLGLYPRIRRFRCPATAPARSLASAREIVELGDRRRCSRARPRMMPFNQLIVAAGLVRARSCCSAPGSAICARPACPIRMVDRGRGAASRARRGRGADRPVRGDARSRSQGRPRRRDRRRRAQIERGLADVAAIDEDRILRLIRGVIQRRLRTNAFAPPARRRWPSSSTVQARARTCRRRCPGARSGSIRRASRASICAAARSPAAACAGPTGATISAPRSSA